IIGNPSLNHRYRKGFYSLFKTLQQNHPYDIVGKILGSDELGIYVGKDKIHYDEIRHIEFYQDNKWSRLE
ncbi:hypothetical protein FIU56_14155, partial [Enterococcus faecium]